MTVTKWFSKLYHPKMYLNVKTKFVIPNSGHDYYINEVNSQGHSDPTIVRETLNHLKMNPHTKFGIPTSINVGDMARTRERYWRTDGRTARWTESSIPITPYRPGD